MALILLTQEEIIAKEIAETQMAPNMAISQASGTAAAICVKTGCRPADLDVADLQKKLEDDDAVVRIPQEERIRS